jgi:hypothetical protein
MLKAEGRLDTLNLEPFNKTQGRLLNFEQVLLFLSRRTAP